MNAISRLKKQIADLEKKLAESERVRQALESAGFDIWENNFVTGETFGSNRNILENLGYLEVEMPKNVEELLTFVHPEDQKKAEELMQNHFSGKTPRYQAELRIKAKDGSWHWIGNYGRVEKRNADGGVTRFIGVNFDINKRRIIEEELAEQNRELREALEHIKTLQGIIPICSYCKKIRDDQGYWDQVETYICRHTEAEFSHSVCPDCMVKHYSHIKNLNIS